MQTINSQAISPETWVANYADYLYNFSIRRLNDEDLARDLVQETFLSGLESLGSFQGKSSEKTWLTSILKYKIINIYRAKSSGLNKNITGLNLCGAKEFFQPEDGHWIIEDRPKEFIMDNTSAIESSEFQRVLMECTKKLPSLWYQAFILKFMDEEQTTCICDALKITQANYWVIVHRIKLNLRACLQKNWL